MNIRLMLCMPFILLLLSACNSSNGSGRSAGGGNDNFVNAVAGMAASTTEDTEPVDVESLSPNFPEDSEPQVIS